MELQTNFRFKKTDLGYFENNYSNFIQNKFKKDCRLIGFTNGKYSLIDLIYQILIKIGKSNVVIATWSAGIKDVHNVNWMIQNNLINDFKLLTDHSYKSRQKKYAASIEDLFGVENIRTSRMHAKFVLIYNNIYKVSITSSMNLNANNTCELFEIEEGDQMFNFLNSFVDHNFENMPSGFTESTNIIMKSLKKFFLEINGKKEEKNKWYELSNE